MTGPRTLVAACLWLVAGCAAAGAAPAMSVRATDGNIVLVSGGHEVRLTSSGKDTEPVLSPDGTFVVYTRHARPPGGGSGFLTGCDGDEIRRVDIDGTGDAPLVQANDADEPEAQLCAFQAKQFSSDGARLYFMSTAWATSDAVHVYDFGQRKERYVLPANDLLVLADCAGDYRDDLIVQQHRYFVFGGSYDWYWLFDPAGKTEYGPLGDFAGREDVVAQAQDWCVN